MESLARLAAPLLAILTGVPSMPTPARPAVRDTMGRMPAAPDSPNSADASSGGLASWFLPILIGAVIGTMFALWVLPALTTTDVERIVRQWQWGEDEDNAVLEEELAALGTPHREDLLQAFSDADDEFPEWKAWIGTQLASEPFLDTSSLKELAKSGKTWDRRVASAVLVLTLDAESIDGDLRALVIPPLFEWVEDMSLLHHELPLRALVAVELAPGEELDRWKAALVKLAARDQRTTNNPDDAIDVAMDRGLAVAELSTFLPDEAVLKALWAIALDSKEELEPRIEAVRALRDSLQFEDIKPWLELAAAEDRIVRQMVAELGITGQATAPELDEILGPLHRDPDPLVRAASIDSQTARRRPTILPIYAQLLEDHDPEVRMAAIRAAPKFSVHPGAKERAAMILSILERSDDDHELQDAIVTMFELTDVHPGFAVGEIKPPFREVAAPALRAFKAEEQTRLTAITEWRREAGAPEPTDADRIDALQALSEHPDPKNQDRAKAELAKLKR